MELSKKNIIAVVAVIILIVVGFVLYSGRKGAQESVVGSQPSGGEKPEAANGADGMRQAIDTQNASLCANIAKEDERKACEINVIIAEAGAKQDAGICGQIQQSDFKTVCKDNVIITKALNAKNPALCEQMADQTRIGQCKKDVGQLK